jgi:hypothetical protein
MSTVITMKVGAGKFAATLLPVDVPARPPTPGSALAKAELAAVADAAWDAARPQLPAPARPVPPGGSTWACTALAIYGDDGKGAWRTLGTAVSTYGPDGKGGWALVRSAVVPYGPDGTTPLA